MAEAARGRLACGSFKEKDKDDKVKKYRQVAKNPKSTDKYLATVTATACTVGNKGQRQQVHSELRSISVVRLDHQDSGYNRLRRNPLLPHLHVSLDLVFILPLF